MAELLPRSEAPPAGQTKPEHPEVYAVEEVVQSDLNPPSGHLTDQQQANGEVLTDQQRANGEVLTDQQQTKLGALTGQQQAQAEALTNPIQANTRALTGQQRAQAEALADRALNGDLEALKTFEAKVPQARQYLIEVFGNLARDTRHQIIESYFSSEDAVRKRGINLAADQLRLALSHDEGDPLERLLIERIACNWIEVHLVEQLTNQLRADDKVDLSQVEYYQKFLDRTQKRFLNGCKALAQVRKLMGVESNSKSN